jgi:hypothetical protein
MRTCVVVVVAVAVVVEEEEEEEEEEKEEETRVRCRRCEDRRGGGEKGGWKGKKEGEEGRGRVVEVGRDRKRERKLAGHCKKKNDFHSKQKRSQKNTHLCDLEEDTKYDLFAASMYLALEIGSSLFGNRRHFGRVTLRVIATLKLLLRTRNTLSTHTEQIRHR